MTRCAFYSRSSCGGKCAGPKEAEGGQRRPWSAGSCTFNYHGSRFSPKWPCSMQDSKQSAPFTDAFWTWKPTKTPQRLLHMSTCGLFWLPLSGPTRPCHVTFPWQLWRWGSLSLSSSLSITEAMNKWISWTQGWQKQCSTYDKTPGTACHFTANYSLRIFKINAYCLIYFLNALFLVSLDSSLVSLDFFASYTYVLCSPSGT